MPIRILKKDKARNDQAEQQSAMAQKQETPKPQNLNSKGSEKANEPISPSARRDERKAQQREQRIQLKEYGMKKGGLSAGQKKIASKAPPPDKIDAKDFAVLKAEKAKGRGMGLQDESIKPGKVMKAKRGKFLGSDPTKPISSVKPLGTLGKGMKVSKAHSIVLGKMSNEKLKEMVKTGINPDLKGDPNIKRGSQKTSMEAKSFLDRRKELASPKNILKAAKATRYGKIALGIAGAALGAKELLKSKMKKEDKKMAGGMAKKYSKGGDLRAEYIHSQTKKNRKITGEGYFTERSATRREEYGAAKDRYPNKMDRRKQMLKNLSRVAAPTMSAIKGVYDALNAPTTRKYSVGGGADMGDPKKPTAVPKGKDSEVMIHDMKGERPLAAPRRRRNFVGSKPDKARRYAATPGYLPKPAIGKMGGGMMNKPMGYKSGTMVKARGCKLGRTRPTKMY